jgi:hypothetical protein
MKLTLELMPSTAWLHSLHTYLTTKAWSTLRKKVLEEYNYQCAICGANGGQLNCNEQWEYNDETNTQRLVRLVMLCQMCHLTAHMMERGSITHDVLAEHFMRVNGCSRQVFDEYYQKCLEERMRREIDDTRGPVIWEQDWGEYASLLAQEGNLKQRYQWHNGYIVSVGSRKRLRKPRSQTD